MPEAGERGGAEGAEGSWSIRGRGPGVLESWVSELKGPTSRVLGL